MSASSFRERRALQQQTSNRTAHLSPPESHVLMANPAATIRRLPQHVTDTVRSTAQAADLPGAACELVLNSMQAGARHILVTASIGAWSLTVEDDGCGIPAGSIPLLGQRCCTSKQGVAGCRGEALAFLAQLSQQVIITSRAAGTFETHRTQLVDSSSSRTCKAPGNGTGPGFSRHASTAALSTTTLCSIPRQRQGTTVSLVGFLHNQPVRRNRLLQQHAGGPSTAAAGATTLPSSTAAAVTAAAATSRASSSALQELQQALFTLLLPYTGVELVLQQSGSSATVLHLPKDRSLESCLAQIFQQRPSQRLQHQSPALQHVRSQHCQGWQVTGAVLTAPAPALSSKQHQLLYVNSRAAACPVLAQLLRDWFIKHVKTLAGQGAAAGQPPGSSRAPEPGYVLLIACPEACFTTSRQPSTSQLITDFSSSMTPLCEAMQAGLGPCWGSLPSAWRKAAAGRSATAERSAGMHAAPATAGVAGQGHAGGGSGGRLAAAQQASAHGSRVAAGVFLHPPGSQPCRGAPLMPAHGLQMASCTRSLAGVQTSAPPQPAAVLTAPGLPTARPSTQHTAPVHDASTAPQQPQHQPSPRAGTQPNDSTALCWAQLLAAGAADSMLAAGADALPGVEEDTSGMAWLGEDAVLPLLLEQHTGSSGPSRRHSHNLASLSVAADDDTFGMCQDALLLLSQQLQGGSGGSRSRQPHSSVDAAAAAGDTADTLGMCLYEHTTAIAAAGLSGGRSRGAYLCDLEAPSAADQEDALGTGQCEDEMTPCLAAAYPDSFAGAWASMDLQEHLDAAAAGAAEPQPLFMQARGAGTSGGRKRQRPSNSSAEEARMAAAVGDAAAAGGFDMQEAAASPMSLWLQQQSAQEQGLHQQLDLGLDEPSSDPTTWLLLQQGQQQGGQRQHLQRQEADTTDVFGWEALQQTQQEQQLLLRDDDTDAASPLSDWMQDEQQQQQQRRQRQQQQCEASPLSVWMQQQQHGDGNDQDADSPLAFGWSARDAADPGVDVGTASPLFSWLQQQQQQQCQDSGDAPVQRHSADASPVSAWLMQQQQQQQQEQQELCVMDRSVAALTAITHAAAAATVVAAAITTTPLPRRDGTSPGREPQRCSHSLSGLLLQQLCESAERPTTGGAAAVAAVGKAAEAQGSAGGACLADRYCPEDFTQHATGLSEFLTDQASAGDRCGSVAAATPAGSCAQKHTRSAAAREAAGSCEFGARAASRPAAGAAAAVAAVAPFINPAAAALSEDTVQRLDLEPDGTAAANSAAESKAGTAAVAPAAAAATAAGCPGTPPCRSLPNVLLLPFSQRLLMSAPPAAKPGRVFARLSSRSTAEQSTAQHSASNKHMAVHPGPAQWELSSVRQGLGAAQGSKQGEEQLQTPAHAAGRKASQPAVTAGTPAPAITGAEVSSRHRRHTSPAVMQQQHLQVPPPQQQQQQQQSRQLVQTRLPFRIINGDLPAAARTPTASSSKRKPAAAVKQDTPKGPLAPAWHTPANPNSSSATAAAAAAAAAAPQSTPRAAAAAAGLQAPALNTPKVPLRSSLKGSRDRGASRPAQQQQPPPQQQQQQQQDGEDVAAKPSKRVRFSGVGGSQEQQQQMAAGRGGAAPDSQRPPLQPLPEPQQQLQLQPEVGAQHVPAYAPSPPTASTVPAPASAPVGRSGTLQWIAGVTRPHRKSTACSSSSRFFSASNKTAPPAVKPLLSASATSAGRSVGSWAGSSSGRGTAGCGPAAGVGALPAVDALLLRSSSAASHSQLPVLKSSSNSAASRSQLPVLSVEQLCGSAQGQLVPSSVTRQQLQEGTIIQQVDSKLVAMRCGPALLAVDQHAADERVQLEALQQQLAAEMAPAATAAVAGGSSAGLLSRQLLQPFQQLHLTLHEARALQQHQGAVEAWGWRVSFPAAAPAAAAYAAAAAVGQRLPSTAVVGAAQAAVLHQVPVLAGVALGVVDLQLYLHQLLEAGGSQPPPGVLRVLRSKACRSAIMFGDALDPTQCTDLVRRLARTELCFVCAHGRPTTVPLVDLQQLADRLQQQRTHRQLLTAAPTSSGLAACSSSLAAALRAKLR